MKSAPRLTDSDLKVKGVHLHPTLKKTVVPLLSDLGLSLDPDQVVDQEVPDHKLPRIISSSRERIILMPYWPHKVGEQEGAPVFNDVLAPAIEVHEQLEQQGRGAEKRWIMPMKRMVASGFVNGVTGIRRRPLPQSLAVNFAPVLFEMVPRAEEVLQQRRYLKAFLSGDLATFIRHFNDQFRGFKLTYDEFVSKK